MPKSPFKYEPKVINWKLTVEAAPHQLDDLVAWLTKWEYDFEHEGLVLGHLDRDNKQRITITYCWADNLASLAKKLRKLDLVV